MRKTLLFVAVLVLTGCSLSQSKPAAIGPSGVWQPPQNFAIDVSMACSGSSPGGKYADCFIAQMSKAGASPAAVKFTRELYKESHGEVGIMTSFNHVGPVDIAWVLYPFHQPSNFGLFLVNGDPTLVNAEDLKQLTRKQCVRASNIRACKISFHRWDCGPVTVTVKPGPTRNRARMVVCSSF